jgi:hypothetical protein
MLWMTAGITLGWVGRLRLILAAVVIALLAIPPSTARACPSAASESSACPCCVDSDESGAHDRLARTPCCTKQASATAPQPVSDRTGEAAGMGVPPAMGESRLPLAEPLLRSPVTRPVRATGPPTWLWCRTLLL